MRTRVLVPGDGRGLPVQREDIRLPVAVHVGDRAAPEVVELVVDELLPEFRNLLGLAEQDGEQRRDHFPSFQ